MRFYIIAGEASGDLHGSNLIKAIKEQEPTAQFRVWGGEKMQQAGADLVKHYKDHAFMGFVPVVKNLGKIRQNFKAVKEDILNYQPDALILIDYSGFNLRLAKKLFPAKFKLFYYISPQVWAWRSNRVKKIEKYTDQLFTILPFETEFYRKFNYSVEFVGHPLLDSISDFKKNYSKTQKEFLSENGLLERPIIALLPGSRKQEVEAKLPVMLEASTAFKDYQIVIAGTSNLGKEFYTPFLGDFQAQVLYDQTYPILNFATAAAVTSGTATMETALFKVPQVVCYKAGQLSYWLVKTLVGKRIKYICMVNLIMEREVVKELIQHEFTADNLVQQLNLITNNPAAINTIRESYDQLEIKLGSEGASSMAAKLMLEKLTTN